MRCKEILILYFVSFSFDGTGRIKVLGKRNELTRRKKLKNKPPVERKVKEFG